MYDCGLVLEGGGMRGVYTAGILDYFMEKGLEFSSVYGVSAGALNGANFISRQPKRSVNTFIKYNSTVLTDERYRGIKYLLKDGNYFNYDFVYGEIPENLDPVDYEAFRENPAKFICVLANLETGKADYFHITDLKTQMAYVAASASLPLLTSKAFELSGGKYLDGGVCDSIPLKRSQEDGNVKNVVVLTQDRTYRKKHNSRMPLAKVMYRQYPEFIKAMDERHDMYNAQTEYVFQQEKEGNTFVIAPKEPVDMARMEHDGSKMWLWYAKGRQDAKECYDNLIRFLENK